MTYINLKYQKNYTEFHDNYQLVLPLNLEGLVPEDDSVRLLSHILEELDYTCLYKAYSPKGRNPAVEPIIMFKILAYAYSQNIYSSRKIEQACRRDINFRWLLAGTNPPDHSTIARFRTGQLGEACEELFYQMVSILLDQKEASGECIYIDGTKIEANANKYTFVWKKSVYKYEHRMQEKLSQKIREMEQQYCIQLCYTAENSAADILGALKYLNEKAENERIPMVYGRGHRKSQVQKDIEYLNGCLERQLRYDVNKETFQGRNSYSKTDPDATFMHMKDDHMRNAQLKPGYNIQIGVDSEYIMSVDIFPDRNDVNTLIPFLKNLEEKTHHKYKDITADAGYENEENYLWLEKQEQTSYIKPQTYEQWKKRSFKKKIGRMENMTYLEEGDCYVCANGRILWHKGKRKKTSATGYESVQDVYQCESCEGCPYFGGECTRSKYQKNLYVSKTLIEKRNISQKNIMTDKGKQYRMNRSIQVEGAFGVLKQDYGFRRFLTRGKINVKTEILLLCIGYNINKLHSKIQNDRLQTYLYELKTA
jgi:transposase